MTTDAIKNSFLALSVLLAPTSSPGAPPSPNAPVQEGHIPGADGVKLFYRKVGSGPQAVVFLHGGPGSNFRGQGDHMERLASPGRTVVLYDQRGSGRSEIVTDPKLLTAEHHVRDLEAVRQHFGLRRVSLIGLSWGCGLAALYATAHPDHVERLLLISPMPPTATDFDERMAKLASLDAAAAARRKAIQERWPGAGDEEVVGLCRELSDSIFRLYLADATPEKLRHAALRCDIPPAAIRNRSVVQAATLASIGRWDLRPILRNIRVPSLVIEGAQTNVPLEATREWVVALPSARLLLLPDAGHEAFLDRPEAFQSAAEEFLSGHLPKDAAIKGRGEAPR